MDIASYYSDPYVRARLEQFLGGSSPEHATAMFINAGMQPSQADYYADRPEKLFDYLAGQREICRSLWDAHDFLIHLDIEYVNFDFPAEPYLDPIRSFNLQQPVVKIAQKVLLSSGISPLHILTGRGHHFVWRIHSDSAAFKKLSSLGYVPSHLKKTYAKPHLPDDEPIGGALARAFSATGMLMEYVAHRILEEALVVCEVPLEVSAAIGGTKHRGREIISLDITEYGDPLHTRSIRMPYSLYLKPWHGHGVITKDTAPLIPVMFPIPQHEFGIEEGIAIMRDAARAAKLAQTAGVCIPAFSEATSQLIQCYLDSDVRRFHRYFYAQDYHPPSQWNHTYDRFCCDRLPKGISEILRNPNDALLTPTGIRNLVRTLVAQQWHPHHITGLVQSKYERDYGWGNEWYVYDASMRAEFYTRLFAGLLLCGRDSMDDFTSNGTGNGQDEGVDRLRENILGRINTGAIYE